MVHLFGGKSWDGTTYESRNLACDYKGNIFLAGATQSTGLATSGSFQSSFNGYGDIFLVKFDSTGIRKWSTYYGGLGNTQDNGIACDILGNVYVAGSTNVSSGLTSSGAYQSTMGGSWDALLIKFDSTGNRLWGTYYGDSGDDYASNIVIDENSLWL